LPFLRRLPGNPVCDWIRTTAAVLHNNRMRNPHLGYCNGDLWNLLLADGR